MSAETLLNYADVAKMLGVSERTCRRLRARRQLIGMKLGHRTIKFRPAQVERCKQLLEDN